MARFTAIIPAGGTGSRMKKNPHSSYLPKLLLPLSSSSGTSLEKEITVIEKTVNVFLGFDELDCLVLPVPDDYIESYESLFSFDSRVLVISGGTERQESVWKGLQELARSNVKTEHVLIHDGARCFVSELLIRETVESLETVKASTIAIPSVNSIKKINSASIVIETLERDSLVQVQTPQGFHFDLLYNAHQDAILNGITVTDDAALVESLTDVKVIKGDSDNIKITTPQDYKFAKFLVESGSLNDDL